MILPRCLSFAFTGGILITIHVWGGKRHLNKSILSLIRLRLDPNDLTNGSWPSQPGPGQAGVLPAASPPVNSTIKRLSAGNPPLAAGLRRLRTRAYVYVKPCPQGNPSLAMPPLPRFFPLGLGSFSGRISRHLTLSLVGNPLLAAASRLRRLRTPTAAESWGDRRETCSLPEALPSCAVPPFPLLVWAVFR